MIDHPSEAKRLTRRQFVGSTLLSATAIGCASSSVALAADPPIRNGKSHLKLSLAGYSFNRLLPRRPTPAQLADAKMTLEQFIEFCAQHNLDGCELTGYYFPKEVTTDYLLHMKEMTFRLGLDISGTAIGNDFCVKEGPQRVKQLKAAREWIDYAAVMGAPVIRIFAGKIPKGDKEEDALDRCVAGINESLDYAATKGVVLALENHGGITSTPQQILNIVQRVKPSPWFGVNFDSGNFNTDDPYADLEKIAPYAVNAQVKVALKVKGKKEPADLGRIVKILKAANYRGYVVLEYEEKEPLKEIPMYLEKLRKLISA